MKDSSPNGHIQECHDAGSTSTVPLELAAGACVDSSLMMDCDMDMLSVYASANPLS